MKFHQFGMIIMRRGESEFHEMSEKFYPHKTHMTRLPSSYFWKLCTLRLREPWSLRGERRGSFMVWEKSSIPIKLTWHDYLIPIFGNCAIFAFASRSIAHLMVRKICSFAPESPPIFLAKGKPTCSSWFLCSQASDPTSSIEYCCTTAGLSLPLSKFTYMLSERYSFWRVTPLYGSNSIYVLHFC